MVRAAFACLTVVLALSSPVYAGSQTRHVGGMTVGMGDGSVRNNEAPTTGLTSGGQPTSCDCSNCSAEHCQPTGGGGSDLALWQSNYGAGG